MLDEITRNKYIQLKQDMDAAYEVFKRTPILNNASNYTTAMQALTSFCMDTMAKLANVKEPENTQEEILDNIEDYKICKQPGCGKVLLISIDDKHYIKSSEFLEDFPGWCYSCLIEHCKATNCDDCTLTSVPEICSFADVAKLHR